MINIILKETYKLIQISFNLLWLTNLSLLLTLLIYSSFYNWYLPKDSIDYKINFELNKNELISEDIYLNSNEHNLHSGQEYSFKLKLLVPESEYNFDIGLFGITTYLINNDFKYNNTFKNTVINTLIEVLNKRIFVECEESFLHFRSSKRDSTIRQDSILYKP